jgi:hypothetical protein
MWLLDSITEAITDSIDAYQNKQRQLLEWILESIHDPFAKEIEWTPLMRGGASFGTHTILINSQGNLEFKASLFSKLLPAFFIGIGLFMESITLIVIIGTGTFNNGMIIPFLMSSIFVIGWIYAYSNYTKPVVFDRQNGYYYKGKPKMNYWMLNPTDKNIIPLSSIYAIQIITERVSTKNSSFLSYEINLVLDDKRRINIVDHGNIERIQADSKQLSEYLGVPVWGL